VNFFTIFLVNIGLTATLFPKFHGTMLILGVAIGYGWFSSFQTFDPQLAIMLIILTAIAEGGGSWLRILFTKHYPLSQSFCVNSLVGNIGGIFATSCILGKTGGIAIWQLVAGKTFLPRLNTIMIVLFRLGAVACLRFICGFIMEWVIIIYILQ
jgi:hypothetical protein